MKVILAGILLSLLLAYSAAAQPNSPSPWFRNGQPTKNEPNMATAGEFAVMQIATTDADRLMADWNKPAAFAQAVLTTETIPNRPIVTFILFTGCRANASGNCNVTADYEMTDSAGKRYDLSRGGKVWVLPPPPGRALQLSADGYGNMFEDKDAPGRYRVQATITDHVAGVTLHTEQTLVVSAK